MYTIPPIYFPAGTYRLTQTLVMTHAYGSYWVGTGATSILKWNGAAGGVMYHSNGATLSTYEGLVFDGAGVAGVGVDHDSRGTANDGLYETRINYENMHFKDFTNSGVRTGYTGFSGSNAQYTPTAEMLFSNSLFENIPKCLWFAYFNSYNNRIEQSAFKNCGTAIDGGAGNFDVTRSNFYGSTVTDLYISPHSNHVSSSTSQGSHAFIQTGGTGAGGETIVENCRVDGWTDPAGAINSYERNNLIVTDTKFTNPPSNTVPIQFGNSADNQQVIISNTTSGGSSNIADIAKPFPKVSILQVPVNVAVPDTINLTTIFLSSAPITAQPVLDVTAFGARPETNTDSSAAIIATIAAAQTANNNSAVYFPTGRYQIAQPISVTGSNYALTGTGYMDNLVWTGSDQQ